MTFSITEEEQILYLVNKYIEKHKIRETEGEAIYQSEKAAEYAVALVADIADILSSESEVLDVDAIKSRAMGARSD